eukprot:gene12795-510_t
MGAAVASLAGDRPGLAVLFAASAGGGSDAGGKVVWLIRHAESEANRTGTDLFDSPLSAAGEAQAAAWQRAAGSHAQLLRCDVVLASPLRRTLHTAALAFARTDVVVEACRHCRELLWDRAQNRPVPHAELRAFASRLPRPSALRRVSGLLATDAAWDPIAEEAAAAAAAHPAGAGGRGFAAGDTVRVRDEGDAWAAGVVCAVVDGRPLVPAHPGGDGLEWDDVEHAPVWPQG